ncbi:MAG: HAD family hydrolase [Desulfocucumaceae bacterium]
MKKTILFDLDGTLLPLEFDNFFRAYLKSIAAYCSRVIAPDLFVHHLLQSTEKMIRNDGKVTNEQAFMESFLPPLSLEKQIAYPLFEQYYQTDFKKLEQYTEPSGVAAQIIEAALAQDWDIVLATNPLFPRVAVEERMRWAGIADYPWSHITSYETSCSCKPNLLYYQEIASKLALQPSVCWMVGNDASEDMIAGQLGFRTFLVTDYLIMKGHSAYEPEQKGSLAKLLAFLQDGLMT